MDCNQLAVDIDAEIAVIHNWVKDHYRPKFPELESLVHHPIDYARVVSAIANEVRCQACSEGAPYSDALLQDPDCTCEITDAYSRSYSFHNIATIQGVDASS